MEDRTFFMGKSPDYVFLRICPLYSMLRAKTGKFRNYVIRRRSLNEKKILTFKRYLECSMPYLK